MRLHENKELFQDAIQATSEHIGIRSVYIKKDYWVTYALNTLFHSSMADQIVFKGGTALSKCYKMIERFSEDIDIVVIWKPKENDNQLKRKLKNVSNIVSDAIPEIEIEGVTHKKGNIRKTVHQYSQSFDEDFGQVRKQIILEVSSLGNFEPYSKMNISTMIYDMIREKGQHSLISEYELQPFNIKVLSKYRTFCEKIMSLVRFSRTDNPIPDLRNKIRHIYDIHKMLLDSEIHTFIDNVEFNVMILKVAHDDIKSYKNNREWILEHPAKAMIFDNPVEIWQQLSAVYKSTFKDLVFGTLPEEKHLIETLKYINDRLNNIDWQEISGRGKRL